MSTGKKDDPRKARLAEALRANLRKRRDQARRRATEAPPVETGGPANKTPESTGNSPGKG
ncbi:MAG: hypothetical protein LCH38_00060 [Proteobacteria bacterium]|nr:hypothetical protein [Pseudomonadota bacterium]